MKKKDLVEGGCFWPVIGVASPPTMLLDHDDDHDVHDHDYDHA